MSMRCAQPDPERNQTVIEALHRTVALLETELAELRAAQESLRKHERRYRDLVEATADWIWSTDAEGVYTYVSPRAADLLGYEPEELVGKTPFDLMLPAEAERVRAVFLAIARAKRPFSRLENVNLHKDGREVVLETSGVPILDETGRLLGYRGIDRDITQKRSVERELREHRTRLEELVQARTAELEAANRRLRQEARERQRADEAVRMERDRAQTYLDIAGAMIVVLDAEERVTLVNRKGQEVLGCAEKDILGKNWFEHFVPGPERDRLRELFGQLKEGRAEAPDRCESRVVVHGGEERIIDWHITAVRDASGRAVGVLISGQDLTERKRMAEALRETERLEAVGTLAEGVAHSFSTILNAIGGHASALTDNLLPNTRAHRDARRIIEATRHAAELTKRLMAVAHASPAGGETQTRPVSVAAVAGQAKELVAHLLTNRKVRIDLKNTGGMPRVQADEGQLGDILMGLFINAIEATPEGGTITVDTVERRIAKPRSNPQAQGGIYVGIRVRDTGVGISRKTIKRVFEPFYTTKERDTALGLGLSVAQSMTHAMGGWIDVRSKEKVGTVFRVFLPRAGVPPAAAGAAEGASGHTVLVIDDRQEDLSVIRRALEGVGHEVRVAETAEAGLSAYREAAGKIAVSLVNFMMPGPDGKTVVEWILQDDPQASIVVTSGFSRDYVRGRVSVGAWSFLQKPFTDEQVMETVGEALQRRGGASAGA